MNFYEHFVSRNNIETIHEMSLKVLREIGVKFEDDRAIQALKARGVKVDDDIAFIPRTLVEEALFTVPKSFTLHSKGQQTTIGEGGEMVKLPWGLAVNILDGDTIRQVTNDDMVDYFKLQDTGPVTTAHMNFNFYGKEGWTESQDKFGHTAFALKYANKPTYVSGEYHDINDFYECLDLIRRFNGYDEDTCYTLMRMNPVSPLCIDNMGLQYILAGVDRKQPVHIASCAMAALTSPPTLAGIMAQTNAEALAALTLTQIMRPGLPVLYGNTSVGGDLRTVQLCLGSPESALISMATVALGRYYGIPVRAGGALNDAKNVDWQAGAESTMMLMATLMEEPDYAFHVFGLLGSMNLSSPAKYILDEENYLACERLMKGMDCSPEKFTFDMIKSVGARGSYLTQNTVPLYRDEFYLYKYHDKKGISVGKYSDNYVPVKERAAAEARKRIEGYTAPEITREQEKILADYLPAKYLDRI